MEVVPRHVFEFSQSKFSSKPEKRELSFSIITSTAVSTAQVAANRMVTL